MRAPPLERAAAMGLTWHQLTDDDVDFAGRVYALTRTEELSVTGWPEETKAAFLDHQHKAQHQYYQHHYPDAAWLIFSRGGERIGRLYVENAADEIRLIDIALLPDHRGGGLGAAIMADLIDWATALGKPISLHVEPNNVVKRLYGRIGFVSAGLVGAYERMDWKPPRK